MKKLTDYEYYRTDLGVLYCGDCLEILPLIDKVDLCITSPPYNLGNNHHTGKIRHNPYNDDIPEIEYQNTQIRILDIVYDVVSEKGSLIYNHKNRIKNKKMITPYKWLLKTKWNIKQELVWFNGSQNFDKCRFYPMTERVYILNKTNDEFKNNINHHDFFKWKAEGTNKEHKRSFPFSMVFDMLNCYKHNNVLDCYFGSGTVGVVCERTNKKWIGIEIGEKYCEIAKQRIKAEADQFKLL
jgi:DNA modification methylase